MRPEGYVRFRVDPGNLSARVYAYYPPNPSRAVRVVSHMKTKNADSRHGRVVDLSEPLAAMLREFVGGRTSGLVFCKPDGSQLMQRDILKHSLHPILKKLGLEQGGLDIFRRFRITKLETAEVPAALQHTWSGHAKSHVSEVYKKLLKQREWRLRWAEKAGTGFTLPSHQQAARRLQMASLARFWNSEKSVKSFKIWWTRGDSNPRASSLRTVGKIS
jgi:hypothetical protein